MWIIQKNTDSDEHQDSIQEMKNRFSSGEMVELEIVNLSKYPNRWDFVNHKHRTATLRYLAIIQNSTTLHVIIVYIRKLNVAIA